MTKTVMIGIARMGSTRLPGKVLMPLGGLTAIGRVSLAALGAGLVDQFVVATTTNKRDDAIENWCLNRDKDCYRGSEDDVLSRFYGAAVTYGADVAVRVTCDCPWVDSTVIDQVIALREATGADYASNIDPPTWPDGLDCEAITISALARVDNLAKDKIDRECVTSYIYRNQHLFHCETLICPLPGMNAERWVLDTEKDYELCRKIASSVHGGGWLNIKKFLDANPELRKINAEHPRNERFYQALAEEPIVPRDYSRSRGLLKQAEEIIPLGAQTFSKSKIQYPADSPLFVTHGDGGYCFDVDGNRYVDLVGGLLPVILGHRDPDVDYAIRRQLNRGISHSLSTELELQLAAKLVELIPSAEMVRFGKNGTDVTTAAVRLARAYTGRDLVLSAGYHGWADWSVGHDKQRNRGVPAAVANLTRIVAYGDTVALDDMKTQKFACVVVEPETNPDYLKLLRKRCTETGTLLVFDEIITWPRWGLGGAQALYRVMPDLTCISKAMGNGMPISALVGKEQFMQTMPEISFSGTFFGETLSLAAAIATLEKLQRPGVMHHIQSQTVSLAKAAEKLIHKHGLQEYISTGNPMAPLTRLWFRDQSIKTLFIQEMAQAGTLIIATHNLSYAHGEPEIARVLKSYKHTLGVMRKVVDNGDIGRHIAGQPIPIHANVRSVSLNQQ